MKKVNKNEVAKTTGNAVAVPDFIKTGTARGTENVEMVDLVIPRIEVIQDQSPILKEKNESVYIEGSSAGMLFNTVTRELYPDSIIVVPVLFKKEFIVWKDRDQGGGFRGAYDTMEEAGDQIAKLLADEDEQGTIFDAADTAQHFVLVVNGDSVQEAVISMSRSKLKVSRQWNSLVRLTNADSFAGAYTLKAVEETNSKGDDYFNLSIKRSGFPTEAVYLKAEKLYNDIKSGAINVKVDDKHEESSNEAEKSTDM